jgi:hypothetical protein
MRQYTVLRIKIEIGYKEGEVQHGKDNEGDKKNNTGKGRI